MRKIIFECSMVDPENSDTLEMTAEQEFPIGTSDDEIQKAFEAWVIESTDAGWHDEGE